MHVMAVQVEVNLKHESLAGLQEFMKNIYQFVND